MIQVTLVGADTCHRYKRMRELVLEEARRAGISIQLIEETEAAGILKNQTVNLPLLFIGGVKIAQGNPPSRDLLRKHLRPPGSSEGAANSPSEA